MRADVMGVSPEGVLCAWEVVKAVIHISAVFPPPGVTLGATIDFDVEEAPGVNEGEPSSDVVPLN